MQQSTPVPVARVPAAPGAIARPIVVVLIGLPGSGKRLVAQALATELGLRRIDREAIRQAMFPKCSHSFTEKGAAFRTVLLALEINCLLGESSVLDGMTFSSRKDLLRVDEVIRNYGCLPIPIFLDCSTEVASARIARELATQPQQGRGRSPGMVVEARARFETPPPNAIHVNASLALDEVSRIVVAAVAQLRAM
jgi:adenylylsulfate kinase-like enzyme